MLPLRMKKDALVIICDSAPDPLLFSSAQKQVTPPKMVLEAGGKCEIK